MRVFVNETIQTSPEAQPPDIHPAPEARLSILAQVWRGLSHPALLWGLLALAGAALAAHLWLPQLPTSLAADPVAASAWLDATAVRVPVGGALRALGLFDVAHNAALRVILPLLAATLLIHLVNGVILVRAARASAPPVDWLPGLRAWDATLPAVPDEVGWFEACADACDAGRMKVTTLEDGGEQRLCDCHFQRQWLSMLVELGLLLALAALLLNLFSGWQVDGLTLDPGASVSLAPYTDLTVGLSDDAAQLTLCCPETSVPLARGRIMRGSVLVRVQDESNALRISLKRGDEALQLQAIEQGARAADELIVHFPQARSERAIAAPAANRFFRLVALDDGGFRVQALDAANEVLFSQDIHEAAALPAGDDLTLTLTPTTFVTLSARGRPWTWLLLPALLLTLVGLVWRWRQPYWRLGVLTNQTGAALRWQGPAATRKRFEQLLGRLATLQTIDEETS